MPNQHTATAQAPANIAFIKYWGNKNSAARIPYHNSISMNISSALTTTTVTFSEELTQDEVLLSKTPLTGPKKERVTKVLDAIRSEAKSKKLPAAAYFARIETENSFPTAAGMASSASGFAALALAATTAIGLKLSPKRLSTYARLGSGSATRSVPDGFIK
jgi:diphosphomevalonate decarboxylase